MPTPRLSAGSSLAGMQGVQESPGPGPPAFCLGASPEGHPDTHRLCPPWPPV